ncbi:MAG: hypothetical protein HN627_04085 [Opitutae bacterium]|jgi:hypothetical protein|nr:hypothetical protein [Opitutae bacterium]
MVQIIIFSLVALMLSSYGSPDSEQQGLNKLQYSKDQWASEIQLSGTFRLRGKGFASLVTPEGNFWVEEGKFSSGYKLIELDISRSQPSALIQKGDQQAWIGLRLGMPNPVKREIARQKLERRGGVLGLLYVKGETEPFTGTSIKYRVDGSKSFEMPYVEGKLDGMAINYYEDGSKRWEIPYVNGKPYGTAIEYNEDGSKSAEYVFENGKEISRKKF